MNVAQTILNAITVGQLVVQIGAATLSGQAVAEEIQVRTSKETIGDFVRWACAGDEPITAETGTFLISHLSVPEQHLAICKTIESGGELSVICRTAEFTGRTTAKAQRAAVWNTIKRCRGKE